MYVISSFSHVLYEHVKDRKSVDVMYNLCCIIPPYQNNIFTYTIFYEINKTTEYYKKDHLLQRSHIKT